MINKNNKLEKADIIDSMNILNERIISWSADKIKEIKSKHSGHKIEFIASMGHTGFDVGRNRDIHFYGYDWGRENIKIFDLDNDKIDADVLIDLKGFFEEFAEFEKTFSKEYIYSIRDSIVRRVNIGDEGHSYISNKTEINR